MRRPRTVLLALLLAVEPVFGAQMSRPRPAGHNPNVLRATVNLVVIDVEVTDSAGRPVKGLDPGDFTLLEDGKPQKISTFVYENVEGFARAAAANEKPLVIPIAGTPPERGWGPLVQNRRLILLFFDLTSLQTPDLMRARAAAIHYVKKQMSPADLVGIVVLGSHLGVLSNFTSDKRTLLDALDRLSPGVDSQLAALSSAPAQEGEANVSEDLGAAWTPDDTEFNVFNTDRKLEAMQDLADWLRNIPGKKIVLQFTSGVTQTGEENRTAVEAATDAANRADVSFYSVDARGLMVEIPGGDASHAASSGASMFSGDTVLSQVQSRQDSRDTLETLAADTGGRAFFDLGNLSKAFTQVQKDTEGYYLLGYTPSDTRANGRWRAIKVKVDRPGLHLRYRTGYFAPRDFRHFTEEDREQQLLDALRSPTPILELPIALETAVFRLNRDEAFVPIAAKLPSSTLQWARKKGSHEDQFDFAVEVRQAPSGRAVAALQDTITVHLDAAHFEQYARRALLYQGGVILAPGSYRLKFVARENETGRIGTFEEPLEIPAPAPGKLDLSTVLLSSQVVSAGRNREVRMQGLGPDAKMENSPLEVSGRRIVPSVTNVFTREQTLYVFFQAYLPPRINPEALRAGLIFFRNGVLANRSPLVSATAYEARTRTASFRIALPLDRLAPGRYTLEAVSVVAGTPLAAFARTSLAVEPSKHAGRPIALAPGAPQAPRR